MPKAIEWQVFCSYPWDRHTDPIADDFVRRIQRKLEFLPSGYAGLGNVSLWLDRDKIHSRSGTFAEQTVPACKASDLLICLLNPKWHGSRGCQDEVACFRRRDGSLDHKRIILIQLSDDPSTNPGAFKAHPTFPRLWRAEYPNLLHLWAAKVDEAERDAFTSRIRDEICAALGTFPKPRRRP